MMRRFYAARIDDSHAGAFLSSDYPPDQGMNGVHDVLDDGLQLPFSEVVIDSLPGSKVAWQNSPLTAGSVNVGTVGKCREFLNKLIDNVMEFSYI
jgi:hypothetical protein